MDLELLREGSRFTLYALKIGDSVDKFLAALKNTDHAEFARIMRRLEQLAENGASKRKTEFNDLGNGLYEAKSTGGSRVIFFYDRNHLVLCAHAFLKKTQKTPRGILEAAVQRHKQYLKILQAGASAFTIHVPHNQKNPTRFPQ